MCGIIGLSSQSPTAVQVIREGLKGVQNRGEDRGSIAIPKDRTKIIRRSARGRVSAAFKTIPRGFESATMALGHIRYRTDGLDNRTNIQPVVRERESGSQFALAHNGNLVNKQRLKSHAHKVTDSDTVIATDLIAASGKKDIVQAVLEGAKQFQGGFSMIVMGDDTLVAIRDPNGIHPLQIGNRGMDWMVASESSAFNITGFDFVCDVRPGEAAVITHGVKEPVIIKWHDKPFLKLDSFELIYLSQITSRLDGGLDVGQVRHELGREFAREHPDIDSDTLVLPMPDSSNQAFWGYVQEMVKNGKLSIENVNPWAILRRHTYAGRTFLLPFLEIDEALREKFELRENVLKGREVQISDDSTVRGKSLQNIVKIIMNPRAGATAVTAVIHSPMYLYRDFFGIATSYDPERLIAHLCGGSEQMIADAIGLSSIKYLSVDGMLNAIERCFDPNSGYTRDNIYTGPHTGKYPVYPEDYLN